MFDLTGKTALVTGATGTIGGIVSGRYVFATKTLDANRIIILQADASLV